MRHQARYPMDKLPIVFASDWLPASIAIKLFTVSRWSHVGIIDGDYVIDTQLMTGCIRTPIEEWKKKHSDFCITYIDCKDKQKAIDFARAQVGTKYDWRGIIGLAVRKGELQEKKKWFCSELVIEATGLLKKQNFRASPQTVWFLSQCLDLEKSPN